MAASHTITGTYFVQNKPVSTAAVSAPTNPIPDGRAYIHRMAWSIDPGRRSTATAKVVAEAIRTTSLPDAVFFVDTCFLTTPLDRAIWDALLTRKLAITRLIHMELQDWLKNPHYNGAYARELEQRLDAGGQGIELIRDGDAYRAHGYEYYCPLLILRKLHGRQFADAMAVKNGVRPKKNEFYAAYKSQGKGFDDRAARIAWKGNADFGKDNYAADEQLVTTAAIHALMTGRETVILTRDHDIMDQFYKLVHLMDTHYRGMLFAERFAANPSRFAQTSRKQFGEGNPDFGSDRFSGEDDLFARPELDAAGTWNGLLPDPHEFVNMDCGWFADGPEALKVAQLVFCADTQMARVLKMKAATGGLNTDLLGGRNCHIWPFPGLQDLLGPCVAIARDILREYHPSLPKMRAVDMIHAVCSHEKFDRIAVEGAEPGFPFPPSDLTE